LPSTIEWDGNNEMSSIRKRILDFRSIVGDIIDRGLVICRSSDHNDKLHLLSLDASHFFDIFLPVRLPFHPFDAFFIAWTDLTIMHDILAPGSTSIALAQGGMSYGKACRPQKRTLTFRLRHRIQPSLRGTPTTDPANLDHSDQCLVCV
jgi:hypothetical protein